MREKAMGRAGAPTHATIDVAGRSSAEVSSIVAATMATDDGHAVAPAGPDTFQLVRTHRPTWALVLGVLGIAFFGLGVLFFLVRKTDICTLRIVDGPTGAVLTVTGTLLPETLESLRAALDPATRAPMVSAPPARGMGAAPSGQPVADLPAPIPATPAGVTASSAQSAEAPALGPVDDEEFDRTVHRVVAPSGPASHGVWLRLPDGTTLPLSGTTLLGRDPAPRQQDGAAPPTLVALADPSLQVSKTHAAVRVAADAIQVEDLHSTNGTVIAEPTGWRTTLRGGEVASVRPGSVLELGGLRIEVGAGG